MMARDPSTSFSLDCHHPVFSFGIRKILIALLLFTRAVAAQDVPRGAQEKDGQWPIDPTGAPRPVAAAHRVADPILVDGRLDEPSWQNAPPISEFIQQQPATGYPATERTVVRVLYDEDRIYIGAECYDTAPERITVMSLEQDFESRDTDLIGVMLDTYLDRRNAFLFAVNPQGALKDGQGFNDGRILDWTWEGPVEVETHHHDWGWSAEIAIPFTTLRFDPTRTDQVWGLQFLRRVRRKNENSFWAPLDRQAALYTASGGGTLVDLEGVRPGRNIFFKPYFLTARSVVGAVDARQSDTELDAGFDFKYGVTPGVTLDVTFRTDFSQVEVDREQVNLTRFSLFFPEKRDFFIENSGIFGFGDVSERRYRMGSSLNDFTLFHSRRIGLDERGQPLPILGGGRVSGRAGQWEMGLLTMQTRTTPGIPAENFSAVRLRRNVLGRSDVGAIFINRQTTEGDPRNNRTYGFDANIRPHQNLIINSYLARTDGTTPKELGGDGWAGRLSLAWRDRIWDASAFAKRVGDAFVPEVGFVRRNGIHHVYATAGAHPRPPIPHVQELNPYGELHHMTDLEGTLETRTAALGLSVDFLDGGALAAKFADRFEHLTEDFRIQPDAVIPVGDYSFREGRVSYSSSTGRRVSGGVGVSGGGFFNGSRTSLELSTLWRVNYHLRMEFFAEHNTISLPDQDFSVDLLGTRINYAYSTRLFASAFVQYNAAADEIVTNLRFNFIHSPLSDLFLVYRERRDVNGGALTDQVLTIKLTKLFSF
jgi:hypothetical protein